MSTTDLCDNLRDLRTDGIPVSAEGEDETQRSFPVVNANGLACDPATGRVVLHRDTDGPLEPAQFRVLVRACRHRFRNVLQWARIRDDGDIDRLFEQAAADLDSGQFWLSRIGRIGESDVELVLALLLIRQRWIEEWHVTSVVEKILIDQVMMSFYHQLRLHEMIGNVQARVEEVFFGHAQLQVVDYYGDRVTPRRCNVDEYLAQINERLLPGLEKCQRMIIRTLRALRGMRGVHAPSITVNNAGHMNVAHQQVNVTPPHPGTLR